MTQRCCCTLLSRRNNVHPTPHPLQVTVHPLRPEDQLLVAATDGIWDVLSNEEVVALAGSASAAGGAAAAARALCEVAEARWFDAEGGYVDDITAVVVRACPVEGKQ